MVGRSDDECRRNHLRNSCEFSSLELSDSLISGLSSCPLSLPSEPPDIGKWFSSYQYESPSQDSSLPPLNLDSSDVEVAGDERKTQTRICRKPQGEGIAAAENMLCIVADYDHEAKQRVAVNSSIQACKDLIPRNNIPGLGNTNREFPKVNFPSEYANNVSECRPCTSNTAKEGNVSCNEGSNNLRKESSSDENNGGWVSTRTLKKDLICKRIPTENTSAGVKPSNVEFAMKEPSLLQKRSALADKTNQVEAEMDDKYGLSDIPGIWNCPRKNKPESGPPLKQLRLERWVHRVI